MKKTCILVGSGPSLRNIDLNLLNKVDTFVFNRSYISFSEWPFIPTYYVCIDGNTIRTIEKDLNSLINEDNGIKHYFINNTKKEFNLNETDDKKVSIFTGFKGNIKQNKQGLWSKSIPHTIDNLKLLTNVSAFSVQIAYMLGYERVGMVGVDARYKKRTDVIKENVYKKGPLKGQPKIRFSTNNDPNHYRSDYHGSGHLTSPSHLHGVEGNDLSPWKKLAADIKPISNFKLWSCTKNSRVHGIVPYKDLNEFLEEGV